MPLGYSPFFPAFGNQSEGNPMAQLDQNIIDPMRFMNPQAPIVNNQLQYQNAPAGQVINPNQIQAPDPNREMLIRMLLGVSGLPGA